MLIRFFHIINLYEVSEKWIDTLNLHNLTTESLESSILLLLDEKHKRDHSKGSGWEIRIFARIDVGGERLKERLRNGGRGERLARMIGEGRGGCSCAGWLEVEYEGVNENCDEKIGG